MFHEGLGFDSQVGLSILFNLNATDRLTVSENEQEVARLPHPLA